MLEGSTGCLNGLVDICFAGRLDGSNFLFGAEDVSLGERQRSDQTYAGSIEVMVSPPVAGTNSLLMNRPVGWEYETPLGAVS